MNCLENKVALITGAGGDVGKAITATFMAEGAKVMAVDVSEGGLATLVELHGSENLATQVVDVAKGEDMASVVSQTEQQFGGLDIAVLNAGIGVVGGAKSPIVDHSEEVFDQVMSVNVRGVWLGIKYAGPAIKRRGGGSIVLMSSIMGLIGSAAGTSAYVASKHAVIGIGRSAAREMAADGIRVNCVNPGQLDVGMVRGLSEEDKSEILRDIPLGRLGTADDVARITLFLASDDSSYITGSFHMVDGGYTDY